MWQILILASLFLVVGAGTVALSVLGETALNFFWLKGLRNLKSGGWLPEKFLRTKTRLVGLGVGFAIVLGFGITSQSPVFGLMFPLLLLTLIPIFLSYKRRVYLFELDRSALTFFYALLGLVRAGLSLPAALFQLSRSMHGGFGKALSRFLDQYDKGVTLQECLGKFRLRSGLPLTTTALMMLELAYRDGFSVIPLLEKILPMMQAEQDTAEKIGSLRKTVGSQMLLAFVLPWSLILVMALMQPQVWQGFWESPYFFPLAGFCLFIELTGVALIWNVSRFR